MPPGKHQIFDFCHASHSLAPRTVLHTAWPVVKSEVILLYLLADLAVTLPICRGVSCHVQLRRLAGGRLLRAMVMYCNAYLSLSKFETFTTIPRRAWGLCTLTLRGSATMGPLNRPLVLAIGLLKPSRQWQRIF